MNKPVMRFRYREPTVDTNRPLTEGAVTVEGFDLQVLPESTEDYDVWDCGFGERITNAAVGAPHRSIPAFPNRKFRQAYIYVNSEAGIEEPRQLEGKRVGILGWSNTAGIWARGALQNYYDVDLTRITWLTARPDAAPVAEGIRIEKLPDGSVDTMLAEGALDAVIDPNVLPSISKRDPRVRRLFQDYKSEEQRYFTATGIFPISHVVTFKESYIEQHPDAPLALLDAYRRARDLAFDRIEGSDPDILVYSWAAAGIAEQRALMGEHYWAYNVADNLRPLEALTQFAHQQGLTPTRLDYQTFFDPAAAAHPGV
jgi:4,5-dihydroxyphthalate decarboxylase